MQQFATLINFPEVTPESKSPNSIVNELVTSRGGNVKCSLATAGRYDLIVVAEFDSTEEAMRAWLPAKLKYGWHTETLGGIDLSTFDKIYTEGLRETTRR